MISEMSLHQISVFRHHCALGVLWTCEQLNRVLISIKAGAVQDNPSGSAVPTQQQEDFIGSDAVGDVVEEIIVLGYRRLASYRGFHIILAHLRPKNLANLRRRLGILNILTSLLADPPGMMDVRNVTSSYSFDLSIREDRCAMMWLINLSIHNTDVAIRDVVHQGIEIENPQADI